MLSSIRLLRKRYSDWRYWCRYTNDNLINRIAALLGLKRYSTLSFYAFRATMNYGGKNDE